MMTLKEAIRHAKSKAKTCEWLASNQKIEAIADCERKCGEEHRQLAEWLMELQRYQWIPCSERMPSENGTYLTTYEWVGLSGTNYTEVDFTDYERNRWKRNSGMIIAWMELPKAYKPKGEE